MQTFLWSLALFGTVGMLPEVAAALSVGSSGSSTLTGGAQAETRAHVSAVAPGQQLRAQLWIDGDQDFFQAGDQVRVRFRTSEPAYVAVIHIDTDGRLELVFPSDGWGDGYVRGQRVYSLPSPQWNTNWVVGGRPGLGYFYLLASPEPLDFSFFRERSGGTWGVYGARHTVRGDPFWVLQDLAEVLISDWEYAPYVEDFYSYHVGRRYDYPTYACYDRTPSLGSGSWDAYYERCDRVAVFLRQYPDYYDTHRYRGDRRVYLRGIERTQPRHGFKERVDDLPDRGIDPWRSQEPRGVGIPRARPEAEPGVRPRGVPDRQGEARARPTPPERQRPRLERRPTERERSRPAASPARPDRGGSKSGRPSSGERKSSPGSSEVRSRRPGG